MRILAVFAAGYSAAVFAAALLLPEGALLPLGGRLLLGLLLLVLSPGTLAVPPGAGSGAEGLATGGAAL